MTEKELNSLYYINIELERIKKQIEDIKDKKREIALTPIIGGAGVTGMPKNPSPTNALENTVINRIAMQEQLNYELEKQLERYSEKQLEYERRKLVIEGYIELIEDVQTRCIFRYRCIGRMSWEEIGAILYIDRRTASRKFYNYIKNHNF